MTQYKKYDILASQRPLSIKNQHIHLYDHLIDKGHLKVKVLFTIMRSLIYSIQ